MKNYYHCILEVEIPEGGLPNGSDSPMREAMEAATTSLHPEAEVLNNWSGWGLSEAGAERVLMESCKDENTISMEEADRR